MYVFSSPLLIVDSILTWIWPSTAETCRHRRTNKLRYLDSCVLTDLPTLDCILIEIHSIFLFYSTFISDNFSEISWIFFRDFLWRVTFHIFKRQCEFHRNYINSCHFRPFVRRRSACNARFLLFTLIALHKIILVFTLQLYLWLSSCPILPTSICYRIFLNISLTVRSVHLTVFYSRPPVFFRLFYTRFLFSRIHVYDIIFKSFIDFKLIRDFSFFLSSFSFFLSFFFLSFVRSFFLSFFLSIFCEYLFS